MDKTFCDVCGNEFTKRDYDNGFYLEGCTSEHCKYPVRYFSLDICTHCFDDIVAHSKEIEKEVKFHGGQEE